MANQRLFISNADAFAEKLIQVGNSMSTTYSYDGDKLTLFWKGRKITERTGVKYGDAFIVHCDGSEPTISKLKVPHRNNDLLMWLLSFNKDNRAYNGATYQDLLAQQREENDWWGYRDWGIEGKGYAFTLCNRSDCGGVHHIAAFIDRKVDKALIKEVLQGWERGLYWPQDFVERLLKKRFGFTDVELSEIYPHSNYNIPLAE